MAGIKKITRMYVKASTLVEVIVAMLIIVSSLFAGAALFVKVEKAYLPGMKINAMFMANSIRSQTHKNKEFFDDVFENNNIKIIRSIKPYKEYDNLHILTFTTETSSGAALFIKKELIISNEEMD
jgi:D-ribose pyranose/furanose isomerase RbsD